MSLFKLFHFNLKVTKEKTLILKDVIIPKKLQKSTTMKEKIFQKNCSKVKEIPVSNLDFSGLEKLPNIASDRMQLFKHHKNQLGEGNLFLLNRIKDF